MTEPLAGHQGSVTAPLRVFCDEAGFTGPDLWDPAQAYFSYASVTVPADESADLIAKVTRDFRLQGAELKAANLVKHTRGRKATHEILRAVGPRANAVVHHKRFALACKFFEYVFEPLLSESSLLFYNMGFQKFVANLLFAGSVAHTGRAHDLLAAFAEAVRSDSTRLSHLLSIHAPDSRDPIEMLISFGVYHRHTVLRELDYVREHHRWTLELSSTSLRSLLAAWSSDGRALTVTCDVSNPIKDQLGFFNAMVGNTRSVSVTLAGTTTPFTFSLAEPLTFTDSRSCPPIQLADTLAGALCHSMNNQHDSWSRETMTMLLEAGVLLGESVLPELDRADARNQAAANNMVILLELLERSANNEDLQAGIGELVAAMLRMPPPTA